MDYLIEKRQGCKAVVNGLEVTIFSSNDYLGLSAHPEVLKAAFEAASHFGIGTGGAPGTTGTTVIHRQLSSAVAQFKSRQNCILFPSGYQANQAIHHSLDSEKAVFYIDKRHHPSAIDGTRLARASKTIKFEHTNLDTLITPLKANKGMVNIVSLPSVFTVDGDIAPLDKLADLKRKYHFILILDEAHATGVVGASGHGLEELYGLKGTADFIMGTFSKALGSQGGFLAFDNDPCEFLQSDFRTFDYSTSLSTVSAAAALKALELIQSDSSILESLKNVKKQIISNCKKQGLPLVVNESMILLLPAENIEKLQQSLFDDGFLTIAVHSLIAGMTKTCLRIVPMATHTIDDVDKFILTIKKYYE